jgi:putative ABC transport system permease protein
MIATDTIGLAFRNLRQAKLRTALTTMGVSIGIASLAGMVSLGVGLQEQLVGRFLDSGLFDVVTVVPQFSPGARALAGRAGGGGGGGNRRFAVQEPPKPGAVPAAPPKPLDDAALTALRALPNVRDASPTILVPVEVTYGTISEFTTARGIPMSSATDAEFRTPKYGTFFTHDTDQACLVLLDLAKRLTTGDPKDLIGKNLTVSYASAAAPSGPFGIGPMQVKQVEASYRIVGILERDTAGPGFGGPGLSNVMVPLGVARAIDATVVTGVQQLLHPTASPGEAKSFASVTVRVSKMSVTRDVEDRIKAMGFSAFSIADALDQAKRAFVVLDILLSLIGSIALAVSSLGIVNTMVMSILERTREIGIMKAIGGSDTDIRRIFLVEASAIGVLGGVCGVLLGWIVGRVINFGANWYIESQGGVTGNLFSLPLWLISGAIAFSWLVSLLAGLYPATRAARLDPIHALRHD